MPKFEVRKSGDLLKTVNTLSETVTIGRMMSCDVALDDMDIALKQILITKESDIFKIEPLALNQTISLNDEPITDKHEIHDGDDLEIGEYTIRFYVQADMDAIAAQEDEEETKLEARKRGGGGGIDVLRSMPGVTIEDDEEDGPIVASDSPHARWEPPVRDFQSPDELKNKFASEGAFDDAGEDRLFMFGLVGPQEGKMIELPTGRNMLKCDKYAGVNVDDISGQHKKYPIVDVKSADEAYLRGGRKTRCQINGEDVRTDALQDLSISDELLIEAQAGYSIFRIAGHGKVDVSPPDHYAPPAETQKRSVKWLAPFGVVVILLLITVILLVSR